MSWTSGIDWRDCCKCTMMNRVPLEQDSQRRRRTACSLQVHSVYRYGTRPRYRRTSGWRISGGDGAGMGRLEMAHGKMVRWQDVCTSLDSGNTQTRGMTCVSLAGSDDSCSPMDAQLLCSASLCDEGFASRSYWSRDPPDMAVEPQAGTGPGPPRVFSF